MLSETPSKSDIIAKLALELPEKLTSGDILRSMNQAYQDGYSAGFSKGCEAGQRHLSAVLDMTMEALNGNPR